MISYVLTKSIVWLVSACLVVVEVASHQLAFEEGHSKSTVLCRSCGREIADPFYLKSNLLSPEYLERHNLTSLFGRNYQVPVEKLRNPSGAEFRVVIFAKAGCRGVGQWTSEATWYPGYSWKVCLCPQCHEQKGWMFEPQDGAEESLEKPSTQGFYALILDKIIDEDFAQSLTVVPRTLKK